MPASPTPAERFAAILLWLGRAVVARNAGDQLSLSLIALIVGRIRDINQRVARLAARICEGRYVPPRRTAPRRAQAGHRRPNPLPQNSGWLLKLVPEAVGYRSQLDYLLRDAETAALLAAAPESMRRPLRSLCRMLGLPPPPLLAPPPQVTQAAAPQKTPPQPPPRPPPPPRPAPAPTPPPPAAACGPPFPA